jgi:hypothetical protein
MPFELRNPGGLWLLGLLVPLVALYLLKVRRQRLRVPSTWLWAHAQRDLLAHSPFRRLAIQLPLLLQLVALTLLALALSRPATRGSSSEGNHLAIVIDTSASMGAVSADGTTRIGAARQAAHELLSGLGPGAQAFVVEAGRDARIASPLDRNVRRLQAAVDQLRARDVDDRLRRLPGDNRLIVITDGAVADRNALATASLPVQLIRVGAPLQNAGVVRIDVRTGVDRATRREQVQAFALVANCGTQPRDVFVTLRQNNAVEPLASRRLQLQPGERSPVVLTFDPAPSDRGTGLIIELSPPDALAADDRAYGRVPEGRSIDVVMAPVNANPWFQRALLADPDVQLVTASTDALTTANVAHDALVVVDSSCPQSVPGASLLVLNPPPGRCRTAVVGGLVDRPSITSWNRSDPRLRFLTLDGVQVLSARLIETEGPGDALVRTRQGPIVGDISLPGRPGTLVAFDVGDSNWPLQASFVLFVRNLVEVARSHRARGVTGPARTGEPLRVRVPPDVSEVSVERPQGRKEKQTARAGLAIVPNVARAGFYHLSWQGRQPGSVLVAANLASAAESDTRPTPLPRNQATVSVTAAAELDSLQHWDWIAAALALLLVALDVWWLTRRPRPLASLVASAPRLPERPRSERQAA